MSLILEPLALTTLSRLRRVAQRTILLKICLYGYLNQLRYHGEPAIDTARRYSPGTASLDDRRATEGLHVQCRARQPQAPQRIDRAAGPLKTIVIPAMIELAAGA